MGYYLPWCIGGLALTTIGAGLSSTFSESTSIVEWVFYQMITGIGRGTALQVVRRFILAIFKRI
jgi:hypothetical protein